MYAIDLARKGKLDPVVGRDEDEDKKWYDPNDRDAVTDAIRVTTSQDILTAMAQDGHSNGHRASQMQRVLIRVSFMVRK